jgi:mannose/fructose/N-acetylgalactosamine-specific phosphotransferase system component IIC
MPLTAGVITGAILGDLNTGLIAGGYIQLAYLGWVSAGGALPSNMFLAGYYGVALTILAGADPTTAPALAVPVGLLGIFVHQAQMTLNAFFVHQADRYAENGNFRGITLMNAVAPIILNVIIYGIPSFLLVFWGADLASNIFESIPEWLVNGLNLVGALMPALGIGMLLNYMGRTKLMPFFFIGFFMVVYLGLGLNSVAVFGILIALFYYYQRTQEGAESHG